MGRPPRPYEQVIQELDDRVDDDTRTVLGLLAGVTVHLPHLMLLMSSLEDTEDADARACLARETCRQIAGVLRLSESALELHAGDIGYEPIAWQLRACEHASEGLTTGDDVGDELGETMRALEDAGEALAAAITAYPDDHAAVASQLTRAQACWLRCYVRARRIRSLVSRPVHH